MAVGEKQEGSFRLSFNGRLRVGRSPISSSQRLMLANSLRSIYCVSARFSPTDSESCRRSCTGLRPGIKARCQSAPLSPGCYGSCFVSLPSLL